MQVEQFLNAVLPTQGYRFSLASLGQSGQPDFRPGQRHHPAGDTSQILARGAYAAANGRNAYFAVGGFNGMTVDDKQRPRRVAADAQWHRCLRLDVDVGPGKDYTDRRTALAHVITFAQTYQLGQPWIIDSGGGFHVYWAFDRDVLLADWLPLAARLRAGCEAGGLRCDHTATTDAARILRLPGTPNNKPHFVESGNVPTVRILQVGVAADPAVIVQHLPAAAVAYSAVPAALRGQQSELQANLHQPYFLRDMLKQCPGLTAMVQDGGARAQEPLWKATLDLINKSNDDDTVKWRVAVGVSRGHRAYSEDGLRQKWQQVLSQDYHPPTCSRMQGAGMPECASCPMRGKISSPLVLGRVVYVPPTEAAIPPPAPAPPVDSPTVSATPSPVSGAALVLAPPTQLGIFLLDGSARIGIANGRLTNSLHIVDGYPTAAFYSEPDANGNRQLQYRRMLEYPMLSVERMLDRISQRSVMVIRFDTGKDGVAEVEFDNRDFAEPKNFFNKLNASGLYCTRKQGGDFVDKFMPEFMQQVQRARAANQISGRCGWSEDLSSFVLGTQVFRNDGSVEHIRTAVAPGEMEGYHVAGDEGAWRRAFDIALGGGVDRQCVLALAIAGPLMQFTGLDGVLLNAYSPESGSGKSTLCDAALSIWGSPNVLRKDFRDTQNATFKLAAVMGNMPMVIDEFTNVEGRALSDYVYTITQGREKHRMSSDARLHANSQRWCLAGIATSNNSVLQKLLDHRSDATAEAARVFELRLHPLVLTDEQMAYNKQALQALKSHYGFLGPQLVRLFLSTPAASLRATVMAQIAKWDRNAASSAGDRFRAAACALMCIGAAIGRSLGYAFDPKAVEEELASHWQTQTAEFESERKGPLDFINGYCLQNLSEFAIFAGAKGDQQLDPGQRKRYLGEIRGVTVPNGGVKNNTVMIPLESLREYVRDKKGNFRAITEWIASNPSVTRYGRLTFLEGTPYQIVTNCVEFKHEDVLGEKRPQLTTVPTSLEQTA